MKWFSRKNVILEEENSEHNKQATIFLSSNNSDKKNDGDVKEAVYKIVETEIKPAHIVCPDCGGITIEGLDYCHKCGGELKLYD